MSPRRVRARHAPPPKRVYLPPRLYTVLALIPPDKVWISEDDLTAAAAAAGVDLVDDKIPRLRDLRRRGLALDTWHSDPVCWTRTPKGTEALNNHQAATASAAADTERHHP